jgi:hypothetical protein
MKRFSCVLLVAALAACDDKPTHIFFEAPSEANLVGTWVGTAEITTAEDIANNVGAPTDRGFNFPVVITLDGSNRFTLFTSGYPTDFTDAGDRTCQGAYTRTSRSLSFFPTEACRALPMTTYTIGRVLPAGITLTARSNAATGSATQYLTTRVFMRLDRD